MRIVHFETGGVAGIAVDAGSGWHGLTQRDDRFPGTLPELIARGADLSRVGTDLEQSPAIDLDAVRLLPPVPVPPGPAPSAGISLSTAALTNVHSTALKLLGV